MEISELGYVLVGAPKVDEWRRFSTDVLGAMAIDAPDGGLYIKTDVRTFRLGVVPGRENGLIASGWLTSGPAAFREAHAALTADGVKIEGGDAPGARCRCVLAYFAFEDPAGHRHEIAWGPISDHAPFVSPAGVSGFVTDDMGLGHVVLSAVGSAFDDGCFCVSPRFALLLFESAPMTGARSLNCSRCDTSSPFSNGRGFLPA